MKNQKLVKDFMLSLGQIDLDKSLDIQNLNTKDVKNIKLRLILSIEKLQELFEAFLETDKVDNDFSPLFNILKNKIKKINEEDIDLEITNIAHVLADLLYINYGTAVLFDIPLQKCFEEVSKANISKISTYTGSPIYREDGKLLYDDSYTPPNIKAILASHKID